MLVKVLLLSTSASPDIPLSLQIGIITMASVREAPIIKFGSKARARKAGELRIEGKDYEVKDSNMLERVSAQY